MPRWASRITLEITNIRVEKLQEISDKDIWNEGIRAPKCGKTKFVLFQELWNSINGKTYPWKDNPWVWCITFKRVI